MSYEILRLLRNILLRTFVIGFILALLLGLVTMTGWTTWMGIASSWFHTTPETLTPIVLEFFVTIRFYLLFIVLAPALALHWTLRKEQNRR